MRAALRIGPTDPVLSAASSPFASETHFEGSGVERVIAPHEVAWPPPPDAADPGPVGANADHNCTDTADRRVTARSAASTPYSASERLARRTVTRAGTSTGGRSACSARDRQVGNLAAARSNQPRGASSESIFGMANVDKTPLNGHQPRRMRLQTETADALDVRDITFQFSSRGRSGAHDDPSARTPGRSEHRGGTRDTASQKTRALCVTRRAGNTSLMRMRLVYATWG